MCALYSYRSMHPPDKQNAHEIAKMADNRESSPETTQNETSLKKKINLLETNNNWRTGQSYSNPQPERELSV